MTKDILPITEDKKAYCYFNSLLIPVVDSDCVDPPVYITDAKRIFFGFFSADCYTDYNRVNDENVSILVRCKSFNSIASGFTVIYTLKIDNPKKTLFENNFVLTNKEFAKLPKIYEYEFLKIVDDKKKIKYNKLLVLKTTELFCKLSEVYSKCNLNSRVWYLVMTALIRPSKIHSSNWLLYASLLDESEKENFGYEALPKINFPSSSEELATSSTPKTMIGIISINSSQFWPLSFVRTHGFQTVLKITRDYQYFAETLHAKGGIIEQKFNDETKESRRGCMANMLFYEAITKHFPNIFDIINENEKTTDDVIIPEFVKNVKYFDSEFLQDLSTFCKRSVAITPSIDKISLQSYYQQQTTEVSEPFSKWMSAQSATEQMMSIHNKFRKHNLTRTIFNLTWSRTALYSKRKYFYSRMDPVESEIRSSILYPLYTPFVFSNMVKYPNKNIYAHIVNTEKLDAPFVKNKQLHSRIRTFIREPTDNNFLLYSMAFFDIIIREEYAFNEQIINNFPIYTIPFDIDIYDKQFSKDYFDVTDREREKDSLIKKKIFFRQKMIDLLLRSFEVIGLRDITEKNTEFILFESLHKKGEDIKKLGFRMIVRLTTYVLANSAVALNVIKVANFLMSLDPYFPGPCLDEDIFSKRNHYLRLPLNCKRTQRGELIRPLIPIITSSACIRPSKGLAHLPNKYLKDKVKLVKSAPNVETCYVTQFVLDSTIARRMIQNKFMKLPPKITDDYTKEVRELILPIVINELKKLFPSFNAKLFVNRNGMGNEYTLGTNLIGICVRKTHIDETKNPCSIRCFINDVKGIVTGCCMIFCFGADCKPARLCTEELPPKTSQSNECLATH